MTVTRKPAVAGRFYPDDSQSLRQDLGDYLSRAERVSSTPKAIIVPHAGYVYSGPVAASGYAQLESLATTIDRVVLMGPAHYVPVNGLAACSVDAFETPLGSVPIDHAACRQVVALQQVEILDEAHAPEHSLEVHVPFLQEVLDDFKLVPLVVGQATFEQVAEVVELLWGGDETLFVLSSDLSHYHDYQTAQQLDGETSRAIESMSVDMLRGERACGFAAIGGMLLAARNHGLRVRTLDVRNSGDTAGGHDRVVGYGAFLLEDGAHDAEAPKNAADDAVRSTETAPEEPHDETPPDELELSTEDEQTLLRVARASIESGTAVGQKMNVVPADYSKALQAVKSSFVTLKLSGELRGCMGSLAAREPLVADVAQHAFAAGFLDPRFPPLSLNEAGQVEIHISVLSTPEPLPFSSEDDLLGKMRPGIDGLILTEGRRRGTLLPSVWKQAPEPREFLAHLKRKTGLPLNYWSNTLTVFRYTTKSIGDE